MIATSYTILLGSFVVASLATPGILAEVQTRYLILVSLLVALAILLAAAAWFAGL